MVSCDCGGGRIVKFTGGAQKIIEWLADGGGALFTVPKLSGSVTFNFNNERGQVTPAAHVAVAGAAPPGPQS